MKSSCNFGLIFTELIITTAVASYKPGLLSSSLPSTGQTVLGFSLAIKKFIIFKHCLR